MRPALCAAAYAVLVVTLAAAQTAESADLAGYGGDDVTSLVQLGSDSEREGSVQTYLDRDHDKVDEFTVGVMPSMVGETAPGNASKPSENATATKSKEVKNKATENKNKFDQERIDKARVKAQMAESKATESKQKISEKHLKKEQHRLNAEKKKHKEAEIEHKEAEQVHKNYIKKDLDKKARAMQKQEIKKKKEVLTLTNEMNDKADTKKESLSGPKGGAMTARGTFQLNSVRIMGLRKEKKSKRELTAKKEADEKAKLRKKELKKKAELTVKKARAVDADEKVMKDHAISENRKKKILAAQTREMKEKAAIAEKSTKGRHKVYASGKAAYSSGKAAYSSGSRRKSASTSGKAASTPGQPKWLVELREAWTADISADVLLQTHSGNSSKSKRDQDVAAREKGQKKAAKEQELAREKIRVDKKVEETANKEKEAKQRVARSKAAMEAKLLDDATRPKPGSGSNASNASNSSAAPAKGPKQYTSADLKRMLRKSKLKEDLACKAAELLPGLANKAKKIQDAANVESQPAQIKKYSKIKDLDKVEESKYAQLKKKAFLKAKEVYKKADLRQKKASAACADARREYGTLKRKLAEAKKTGFVKTQNPPAAFEFLGKEIENYPSCKRVLATQSWQQWIAMKTDHDLRMAKKELECRQHRLELQSAKVDALTATVKSAKQSLDTIKGATRCVLHPTVSRVFKMLDGETQVVGPQLKSFIAAVEQQRKVVEQVTNATKAPKPTRFFFSRDLRDPFDSLGDPNGEVKSLDGDLGESELSRSQVSEKNTAQNPTDRLELGAEMEKFEDKEDSDWQAKVKQKEQALLDMKKRLLQKTQEVKEKNAAASLKAEPPQPEPQPCPIPPPTFPPNPNL